MIATKDNLVHILELRRLLHAIKDSNFDIGVRFRILGGMWQTHHFRVFQMTDKGVLLKNGSANRVIFIQNLKQVVQFELDQNFQQYQPHIHYKVDV